MEIPIGDLEWVIRNPQEAMALFAKALRERGGFTATDGSLGVLERTEMIKVPSFSVFIARKVFQEGHLVNGVKVCFLGEVFRNDFLLIQEKAVPRIALHSYKLTRGVYGETIYPELVGSDEIALAHFWELLKNNSKPFVVAPCHGQFVWAHWLIDRKGWFINACPFKGRGLKMEAGDMVVTG